MPPLTYIHASEAARTTAGGRSVDGGISTPPTGRKWLNINRFGARIAGVHMARLCPACSRKRDIPFLSPFSLPPRGEEAQMYLFVRLFFHLNNYQFKFKTSMKRKDYERPTMQVVKLQQQTHLMAGSGVQSMRSGYGEAQEEDWDE